MLNSKTAPAAGALLGLLLAANANAQGCATPTNEITVEGNKTVTVCISGSSGTTPKEYSYRFFGSGYSWQLGTNAGNAPTNGTIAITAGPGQDQSYTLTTSGLPFTGPTPSSTNYAEFIYCYRSAPVDQCMTGFPRRIKFKVDPIVRLTPSATINTNGMTQVVATLGHAGDNPTSGVRINATCTEQNEAGVSVSPDHQITGLNGSTAQFTIHTENLQIYAPPGPRPLGSCTFAVNGGNGTATIQVSGERVQTTLSASPTQATLPAGSASFTQTVAVSTNPIAANAPINVACPGMSTVPSTTNPLITDSWGRIQLDVTATDMVTVYPAPAQTRQCTFTLGTLQPVTYTAEGVSLGPNVNLNPSSISGQGWTGSATVTAGLSHPYPDQWINAACSSTRPADVPVSVAPSSVQTNSAGQAAFLVTAPTLGYADPNIGAAPTVVCRFWFVSGYETPLYLPTGNACTASGLWPLPAVCGNPQ